jgi:ATP-binding cassette subfamily B protein
MFAVGGLQQFLVDLVLMAVVLCWMLSYSVPLTLLLWVPLPLLYVAVRWYHRRVHRVYRLTWRRMAGISAHLADTIPGIQVVKGFSQEDREIDRFGERIGSYKNEFLKAVVFSAKFSFCVLALTQIGTLIAYWVGGSGAITRAMATAEVATAGSGSQGLGSILGVHLTIGELGMFMGWMGIMYMPVQRLSVLAEQFEQASTSAARVFEVLDTEPNIGANDHSPRLSEVRQDIRFENVSFNYPSGPPVLKNVSFTVRAGETVGIVGPSGSGKTTLVKALCRFYDPMRGRILVDGHELATLNLPSYRMMLGIVDQNPFLFGESILENIRYGRPEASPEEVVRAARTANAHDFIMRLPEGYDTQSQERGTRFSGGERQRICIARAVLKDPAILVLDEATSAVDTRNEKLIQSALNRLIRGRTTFIIAHRLSTLRNADRILVMDKGELVDMAPHEVLMKRCATYTELVKAQTELQKVTQEVA